MQPQDSALAAQSIVRRRKNEIHAYESEPHALITSANFTLIEPLVVIAIIAILAAILFPVLGRARENARRFTCQSNLKQIGLSFMQYSQDYDELFPPHTGGNGA
jgi:prepilin-type N-terminal cleavage/methylation domain-containing protein